MRRATGHAGWLLAVVNALAFCALLASKPPEYEALRERDKKLASGGGIDFTSADPIHLAGRPFYSSAHDANVPLIEDLYFMANFPASMAMGAVGFSLSAATHEWWTGSPQTPGAWESWVLALVFVPVSAVWGFALGGVVEIWRGNETRAG
jgi:hypothetical protein